MEKAKQHYCLQAENLNIWIGKKPVIQDISFCSKPGITAILGENGAGKTTLMRGMLQLGDRQSGALLLSPIKEGRPIALSGLSHRARARYLAYVPQELQNSVHCQVLDFVVMGCTPYLKFLENPGKADYERAEQALSELQIAQLSRRNLDQISGGERKLAYLARARVQRASWMLLDEPMAGLDFGRQHHFFQTLQEYVCSSKTGAVVTIHDPLMAWMYCSQILVLKNGRLQTCLEKEEQDFERRYLEQLRELYGMDAGFADTPKGRTIIWRKKSSVENKGICAGREPGTGI